MSYRSFCSVVLRPGGGSGLGEENDNDPAPASSITKMTSIVQITSDDAAVTGHLDNDFFDHHRDDFFSRRDDEFLTHRRGQQTSDDVVTCEDVSSRSSQAVVGTEEQAPDGSFWSSRPGKVASENSVGDSGSVIQVVRDCDTGSGGVGGASCGGGQEKSSLSRPVLEAVSAISVEENETEECFNVVATTTAAAAAAAVPVKTSGGNNTTKVYLNAEEIENASVIDESGDSLNSAKTEEPEEISSDEKGEVSETESDTKTETSETESETKNCDVVESSPGSEVHLDTVCDEKMLVSKVLDSDEQQHFADAPLSPPLSIDSSNQESILDSLDTVDTTISGVQPVVRSEHSIVLEVNPQPRNDKAGVHKGEACQIYCTSTTEAVEDTSKNIVPASANILEADLVETSQFGALSPAVLDFEEEDSAPASLSTAEDALIEKRPKVEECVEKASSHSTVAVKQEPSVGIKGCSMPIPSTDNQKGQKSGISVQKILNLNSKEELTTSSVVANASEIQLEKTDPKDVAVTKADAISLSSLEKVADEDRPSATELDLPLLTKSVKELAAEIAQAESGGSKTVPAPGNPRKVQGESGPTTAKPSGGSKTVPAPGNPRKGQGESGPTTAKPSGGSKTVPAPGNPRKGQGESGPTTAKPLPQVVAAKPRLSKAVVPPADQKNNSSVMNQEGSQSDISLIETKDSTTTVLHDLLDVETSAETKIHLASVVAMAVPQAPVPLLLVSRAANVGPSSASDDEAQEHVTVIKRSFTSIQLKEGEVDEASILSAKGATKQYWEDRMMAAAAPAEEAGWEPVANVCFRDPNAPADSSDEQSEEDSSPPQDNSPTPEFLPAPPPQFDNSPPASIEDNTSSPAVKPQATFPALQNYEDLQKVNAEISNKDEKLINLDEEISTLEREVLGDDVEDEEEAEMIELMGGREMEEMGKPNLQYVYGEEGSPQVKKPQQQQITRRGGEPNRIPTVKSTLTAAQIKENVIEAEIRAQQKRERELHHEQKKKQQLLKNLQNTQKSDDILRKKGASSPQDSDEGFVDPPVERNSTLGGGQGDAEAKTGFTHSIPGLDGEAVIYDAVSPAPLNGHLQRSAPIPATRATVPTIAPKARSVAPPPATAASNTTETKIALEIRELKEREEELRRMRDAAKRTFQNGSSSGAEADDEFVPDEHDLDEDTEDRGSSSSRELLDDHLASLITTTDEGNYSECGDATSCEDKSSNGSNSRIMSPEVPPTEYPRPPRRVTVRPYQDEEEDQPVYARMKNESVIEREIRMAKERDEAFKKEKGLILNGASAKGSGKHATLRQTASLSAIASQQNGHRDCQQNLATSRIQLEIAETSQRERELLGDGKVLSLSEDTIEHKVTRLSDLSELPAAQVESQARTKSPTSSSASTLSVSSISGGGSNRQSPNASPHATLTSSGRLPQQNGHHTLINGLSNAHSNGFSNGLSNGHHFNSLTTSGSSRLTRSLSTTNLSSSPSSLTSVSGSGAGLRPPKGFMEKFIASRGKMTPSAFSSPPPMGPGSGRVVATRPMRVQPKAPVILRQQPNEPTITTTTTDDDSSKLPTTTTTKAAAAVNEVKVNVAVKSEQKTEGKSASPQAPYKRFIGAEEKIQEELRDMQQREEELRQMRTRNMARSQPNLLEMGLSEISFEEEHHNGIEVEGGEEEEEEGEAGLRSAVSNPNLLDDGPDAKTLKSLRRRSTLIAEWENRIQSTTVADA